MVCVAQLCRVTLADLDLSRITHVHTWTQLSKKHNDFHCLLMVTLCSELVLDSPHKHSESWSNIFHHHTMSPIHPAKHDGMFKASAMTQHNNISHQTNYLSHVDTLKQS